MTEARPSPEFKTASDNVSHALYDFLEDLQVGVMFLVSSRSARYFRDVTCASAGTVPKGDADWRTIVGFDKANGSPEHSTNAATRMDEHPPAIMVQLRNYVRQIAWTTERMPGIGIAQAKVDISAAFKQVWLAPSSTCRLATQLSKSAVGWPRPDEVLAAITK